MPEAKLSRRELLRRAGLGAAAWAALAGESGPAAAQPTPRPTEEGDMPGKLRKLSESLYVHEGAVRVGIVRDGEEAMLLDCGDGEVMGALASVAVRDVRRVCFTHHHRDQACAAGAIAAGGAELFVPEAERPWFEKVQDYWADPKSRWHLYNLHPHHLMLAEPVPVAGCVSDGQTFTWGPAKVRVLSTPGHTDGSVSYLVDVDGRTVAFTGDLIYDAGKVWDIHSLQKGQTTTDYHGFLGARKQLAASLRKVRDASPKALAPSHGRVMTDPPGAIDALLERLDACYDSYVAISALRHYFPKLFADYAGRADHMAIRKGKPVPACLRHFGTTWVLLSQSKAALVMDCGGPGAAAEVRKLLRSGQIAAVEGLWITHYHDDHVDGIPAFVREFGCPVLADRSVAEVVSDPLAWRLPCISPERIGVDRMTADGESWTWREFKLTAFHLPGQTLYHGGLLVEHGELRMLFAGDSFTPAGIDDYCAHNRNHLGRGVGFDRCVELVRRLKPTHIFNPHVDIAFEFTDEQCRFMQANLARRVKLFGGMVGWEHANYAMDEPWLRAHPYEQRGAAGGKAVFDVVITNHSSGVRPAAARAVPPRVWDHAYAARPRRVPAAPAPTTAWSRCEIAPGADGPLHVTVDIPASARRGRYVIPVDVRYASRSLPQFTEAVVVL